ncbi:LysR family transcriptional regulator [Rhodococcus sp. 05-2254-5]|uniref:LysR family transcriptional regulator n=1 Tax=unclassified Rhodococcus (in: high G+C Gram-positive bacteria) TaxID=192944 RepID=UPI000B9A9DC1|nr:MULTISPECIES: LysR family transcriptional regulator [unclassified Rhodococcus (in: high G+C Gram-positive bacteria)]OZE28158.1 LysR family transcriptional regulator [Rhodococcus sp. 05-2254-5]OZE52521.1 LysR family transcriptional regulator [Rhodococcus sp. 05-2254-1]
MELRHLHQFVAVAETCHFGQAAKRLHLAQPALSQSVRQLEAELGVTLLTRTTRQVSLTPAGEFFYRETVRNLDNLERSNRGVRRIADGRYGLVRIGFTGTAAFDQLPPIARAIKQRLPGIALEIHGDLLTPAQVEGLRSEQLDVAVLRPPVAGDDLVVRTITTESLLLAVPVDHRYAAEAALGMADLMYEDFVMYADTHSVMNDAVVRSCRAGGFRPRREHEAPDTSVLLALVAAGLGVALVPESVRALQLNGVVFREIAGASTIDLALAWHRDRPSALVDALVAALEDAGVLPPLELSVPPAQSKDAL